MVYDHYDRYSYSFDANRHLLGHSTIFDFEGPSDSIFAQRVNNWKIYRNAHFWLKSFNDPFDPNVMDAVSAWKQFFIHTFYLIAYFTIGIVLGFVYHHL